MIIRENYLKKIRPFYDIDIIKILVGVRRCGKSVILKQIIEELKKTKSIDDAHIISINFESIEYRNLLNYEDLYYYIKSKIIDSKIYYIFFDEIQVVENFELGINSLRANFSNVSIPPEEITYFMIGLPSDNNLDDNQEKKYIIPYAIYTL